MEHSTCTVRFENRSQLEDLRKRESFYLSKIDSLAQDVQTGNAFRVKTAVSFKLVAALAKFHSEYKSTGEVTLNGKTLHEGDGAALEDEGKVALQGVKAADVLVFDLA